MRPFPCFVFAAFLALLSPPVGVHSLARQPDTEQDLVARIQRETSPVKKAKYQVRLGRVKLLEAVGSYHKGNYEGGEKFLAEYLEQMKSSWATLRGSGRRPVRQPQGFKDLDIALREDSRTLEDLRHRVPYSDRDPVEKAAQEVEQLRGEVLRALFPSERPVEGEKKFVSRADRDRLDRTGLS